VSKEVDSVHGNYLKWNRTAQDTSNSNAGNAIQQVIENAQYVIGDQYVTLSFWLKDEAGLGSGFVRLRQAASPYSRVTADNQDETWYSSSTEWEYHTFTFKIKSAADISTSNVQLLIRMDNGTAQGGVSIAKVQLELGKVATPFEHRSYGEELALAQRFYQQYGFESGAPGRIIGSGNGGSGVLTGFTFQYQMRTAPSINYYGGGADGGTFNIYTHNTSTGNTAPTATAVGTRSVRWNFNGNSSYPNSAYWIDVGTGTSQFAFTLDAEL